MKGFRIAIILGVVAAVALVAAIVTAHAGVVRPIGPGGGEWRPPVVAARGSGQSGGPGAGAIGQVNPEALKALEELRDQHVKDMQAWWSKYGQDPMSAAAQKALTQLRNEHRTELQELLKKYDLQLGRGLGYGRALGSEGWRQWPGRCMQGGFGASVRESESL